MQLAQDSLVTTFEHAPSKPRVEPRVEPTDNPHLVLINIPPRDGHDLGPAVDVGRIARTFVRVSNGRSVLLTFGGGGSRGT